MTSFRRRWISAATQTCTTRRCLGWAAAGIGAGVAVVQLAPLDRFSSVPRWAPAVSAAPIPIGVSGSSAAASASSMPDDGLCSLVTKKLSVDQLREALTGARAQYINIPGFAGVTPLMLAAYQGNAEIVNVLLDFGADTESETIPPRSPNQWRNYFDPYPPQGAGWRAIDFAILGGNPDTIVTLIERGRTDPTLPRVIKLPPQAPMRGSDGMVVMPQDTKTITLDQRIEQSWKVLSVPTFEAKEEAKGMLRGAIKRGKSLRDERLQKHRLQFPLEARLAEQLVGQQPAIQAVSSAVRRKENGWVDSESPLVMLFMGSSGIGKTRTAKLIGEYLHSSDGTGKDKKNDCFIRIDMSEFQHKHEVSKFIGSPPGYVGYEAGGQLVSKLEKCPNAVVLLDEVEKAHPDVLTVMLQAFDEGRMTDGKGKTIDCSDAVFVLTSNLAQREIADEAVRLRTQNSASGATTEVGVEAGVDPLTKAFKRDVVQPILRKHFGRDEFIGRINEILFFLPFTEEEQQLLANKELQAWAKRAKAKQGIELTWSPEVCAVAAEEYDIRYGARSVKYEIDRMCIAPIARAQEEGVVKAGCKVHIDVDKRVLAQLRAMAADSEKRKKEHQKEKFHIIAPKLAADFSSKPPADDNNTATAPPAPKEAKSSTTEAPTSFPPPKPLPGATLYRGGKVALSVFPPESSGGVKSGFSRLLGL